MKAYLLTIITLQVITLSSTNDIPPTPAVRNIARVLTIGLLIWALVLVVPLLGDVQ